MKDKLFEHVDVIFGDDGVTSVEATGESVLDLAALALCVVSGEIEISDNDLDPKYRREMFDALVRFGSACYLALGVEAARKAVEVPGTEYYDETTD